MVRERVQEDGRPSPFVGGLVRGSYMVLVLNNEVSICSQITDSTPQPQDILVLNILLGCHICSPWPFVPFQISFLLPAKIDIDSWSVVKMHSSFNFLFFILNFYFLLWNQTTTCWIPLFSTFNFFGEYTARECYAMHPRGKSVLDCHHMISMYGGAQVFIETVPGNTYRKLPRKTYMSTTTTIFITPGQHLCLPSVR